MFVCGVFASAPYLCRLLPEQWASVLRSGGQGEGSLAVRGNRNEELISFHDLWHLRQLKKPLFSFLLSNFLLDIKYLEKISAFFDPKGPLWCLIDLYGSCSAIELEETSTVEETQEEPGQSVEATAPPVTPYMYPTISTTTFDRQLTPPPSYENLFSYRGNT